MGRSWWKATLAPDSLRPERFGLVVRLKAVDDLVDLALHHVGKLIERQPDAMVGEPALGEVVGADSLAPVPGADHAAAGVGMLLGRAFLLLVKQARAQDLHGLVLVLE